MVIGSEGIPCLLWENFDVAKAKGEPFCNNQEKHTAIHRMDSYPINPNLPIEGFHCSLCDKRITVDQIVDAFVDVTSKIMSEFGGAVAILFYPVKILIFSIEFEGTIRREAKPKSLSKDSITDIETTIKQDIENTLNISLLRTEDLLLN